MRLGTAVSTYDHRRGRTRDPVRSPIFKPSTGRLVVRWVTIGESRLLYVLIPFLFLYRICCSFCRLVFKRCGTLPSTSTADGLNIYLVRQKKLARARAETVKHSCCTLLILICPFLVMPFTVLMSAEDG